MWHHHVYVLHSVCQAALTLSRVRVCALFLWTIQMYPGGWIQASPSTCTGTPSSPRIAIFTVRHCKKWWHQRSSKMLVSQKHEAFLFFPKHLPRYCSFRATRCTCAWVAGTLCCVFGLICTWVASRTPTTTDMSKQLHAQDAPGHADFHPWWMFFPWTGESTEGFTDCNSQKCHKLEERKARRACKKQLVPVQSGDAVGLSLVTLPSACYQTLLPPPKSCHQRRGL